MISPNTLLIRVMILCVKAFDLSGVDFDIRADIIINELYINVMLLCKASKYFLT